MTSTLKRFVGKVAIVTASTEGIGFAIAKRLAQEGAKVIISSRKQKNVEEATKKLVDKGLDVKGLTCHVSQAEDRNKLFEEAEKFGGMDILISNAAVSPYFGGVLDCPEDAWDKIFDVNVKAPFLLAKESVPLLKSSKAGRIIFISSIVGFQPSKVLGPYGISKTALIGLTKAVSLQLAKDNITVNSVAPGLIQTKFSAVLSSNKDILKTALPPIPMNRVVTVFTMATARLLGRKAVVTASTDGIGLAIARRLAQEGAKVIISSRQQKNVDAAKKELQDEGLDVSGLVCHVSKREDRKRLFEAAANAGGLDILINNAGVNPYIGGVFDCPEDKWDKIFDVNIKSAYLLGQEALPLLKESKFGRLIYISTVAAFYSFNTIGVYGISKTALCALVKSGAIHLGPDNITVNSIAPGHISTKFATVLSEHEKLKYEVPVNYLGRIGLPKEIAGAVAFLASDDGSYVTGENIIVSGGMNSRL